MVSTIVDRLKSPIFGNFILSWLGCNWKVVYFTIFVNENCINGYPNKLVYIQEEIFNSYSDLELLFYLYGLLPLIFTIFMVTFYPWVANKAKLLPEKFRNQWNEKSKEFKTELELKNIEVLANYHKLKVTNTEVTDEIEKVKLENRSREIETTILSAKIKKLEEDKEEFLLQKMKIEKEYKDKLVKELSFNIEGDWQFHFIFNDIDGSVHEQYQNLTIKKNPDLLLIDGKPEFKISDFNFSKYPEEGFSFIRTSTQAMNSEKEQPYSIIFVKQVCKNIYKGQEYLLEEKLISNVTFTKK
ncbi:MAG: hypothetical protein ACKVOU_01845 [Cytophagales bacterium]